MAHAPDGTIEAIHIKGTNTIGVQNHPEKDIATNAHSRKLFAAFGLMLQGKLNLRSDAQYNYFPKRFLTRQRIALRTGLRQLAAAKG